jgi:hypothetical protein
MNFFLVRLINFLSGLQFKSKQCEKLSEGRKLKSILNIRRQKFIDLLMQIYCNYDVLNIIQICLAAVSEQKEKQQSNDLLTFCHCVFANVFVRT